MAAKHSTLLRGLSPAGVDTTSSLRFEGRFGRLFKTKAADFGSNEAAWMEHLGPLAEAMVSDPDPPKDGPDPEESGQRGWLAATQTRRRPEEPVQPMRSAYDTGTFDAVSVSS